MRRIYRIMFGTSLAGLCILFFQCTSNPFGEEETISNGRLFGHVTLNDEQNPGGVFVWFEPFDISTRSDSAGFYSLDLPNPSTQSVNGLNGIYKLYFYVANYEINTLDIPLTNGKHHQTNDYSTVEEGRLPPVELKKILHIEATQYELLNTETQYDSILTHFTVQAMENDVSIKSIFSFPITNPGPQFMAGLVHSLRAENPFLRTFLYENPAKGHRTSTFNVSTDPINLIPMLVYIHRFEFPDGHYEFIPYITIDQPDVPQKLLDNLGKVVMSFGLDYIDYPIKILNNELVLSGDIVSNLKVNVR